MDIVGFVYCELQNISHLTIGSEGPKKKKEKAKVARKGISTKQSRRTTKQFRAIQNSRVPKTLLIDLIFGPGALFAIVAVLGPGVIGAMGLV